MSFKKITFYFYIVFLIIIEVAVIFGLFSLIFGLSSEIIAALIAFIGAVIGGALTFIGVNKTLKHRDREIFLQSASDRLASIDRLIHIFTKYLNRAAIYELSIQEKGITDDIVKELIEDFYESLIENKKAIYKSMTFDEIEILDFQTKTIRGLVLKKSLNSEDVSKGFDTIRNVNQVILVSKKNLRNKYYKLKKKSL